MFLYLDGCDDLINLDKVLRIEFRDVNGNLATRPVGEVTPEADVHTARVHYDYPEPGHGGRPQLETYYNTSARELYRKVRDYFA